MRRLLTVAVAAGAALTGAALSIAAPSAALATASRASAIHGVASDAAAIHGTPPAVTIHGPHMYNPATGQPFPQASTVTVTQDTQLAAQMVQLNWSNFTPSTPTATAYTNSTVQYPVMITECNRLNPTNPDQCFEATNGGSNITETAYGASNDAYAVTAANGTGQADISVLTGVQNQFLGCGPTHPCSIAVVPAQGGNNLVDPAQCSQHLYDPQGAAMGQYTFTPLTGTPNSQCAWAKRIIIPLHFALSAASCPLRAADFSAEGSPMLARAMQQWQAGICKGSNSIAIQYNSSVNEYEARNFYASGVADVAFATQPFASGTSTTHPYTYAPVAITATSVAYWLDDTLHQRPYTNLRLNARMVAKLLTTSYSYGGDGCPNSSPNGCDSGVDGNPISLVSDPEFKALNPTITNPASTSYQIPTIMSGQSDMTWAVTSWIAADKDAAGFLSGTFDPWGMHVNTYYLGLKYPTDQFTTQDPYIPVALQYSPTFPLGKIPYYQSLNWQPGLQDVKDPLPPHGYLALPEENPGQRALFAVLDQADAAAYLFPVAALENHAGKYVEPTTAAMSAAVQDMTVNSDGITRSVNLTSKDPREYPLTMVVYAIVPTGGISHAKAAKIAQFLDFAAGAGQQTGLLPGKLPPGYLPLTQSLRKQTLKAAQEVLDQVGNKPSKPGGGHTTPPASSGSHSSTPAPSSPAPSSSPSPESVHEIAVSFSRPDSTGMSWVVLALLIAGFIFGVSGPAALVYANPKARARITAIRQIRIRTKRKQS